MWPLPPVILMFEGSANSLIYMPKATKNAIKYAFVSEVFPNIDSIKVGDSENIEELLSLNPDLFICHNANIKLCEAMKKVPFLPLK
ncbi:TroA family protein [Helicobacter muridarum]|uniref:Periplasmic binding protein n=1 Tax=Helicobacter muridarum TaxID=216 RepID=A0A377PS80_9HELI|nr:hypothetical protein [Helicobacter muridarum]STQ85380.1 periplasmic binding protein [Helicobacter muridarum]